MTRIALIGICLIFTLAESTAAQSASEPARGVSWLDFEEGVKVASETQRPILVDIYAPWCGWCTRLQTDVYTDQRIQRYLADNFAVARLNIDTVNDEVNYRGYKVTSAELATGLGATGTPTTVFLEPTGHYITRLPGFLGADEFIRVLQYIGTEAYKSQSFEAFVKSE